MIESNGITIIRTNPDAADFNMYRLINQIHKHIAESTKNQTKVSSKKPQIDDLSKRLLELEFKQQCNKIKVFQMDCQKYFAKSKKMKSTQSKIKPIKIGKRPGTMYCFGCKDFTHNFRPQEVKMTNKVLRKIPLTVLFVDLISQDF